MSDSSRLIDAVAVEGPSFNDSYYDISFSDGTTLQAVQGYHLSATTSESLTRRLCHEAAPLAVGVKVKSTYNEGLRDVKEKFKQ